ncbi:GIY-YIG endonuclease [Orgyia pseudotsugata single capsid nuclopolyhedrovirus]|nr:GIY-YIG endonuclease [Orgyia pseudotsugata single capsid nuclopolyhedrovirus]
MMNATDSSSTRRRPSRYALYIVETEQKTLYTGITTDVVRRFDQHCLGSGAKFLRNKHNLKLVYRSSNFMCGSCAVRVERFVKRRSKAYKLKLINRKADIKECIKFTCRRNKCLISF